MCLWVTVDTFLDDLFGRSVSKNVPDVGQKKQLYEELSLQQQSTTVGHGKPSLGHLNRKKHRAKPNSLIQKLLDRFDSPKHFT